MHEFSNDIIEKRIDKIIEEWNFNKRKETNPEECICYQQNKPCHNIENLNCLLCFCPNYDTSVKEGKCRINAPKRKYIDNCEGKILDCSDCDFPHKRKNVKDILLKIYTAV